MLCTPIADAGFLLDFPLRLLSGIPMVISESAVWGLAIGLNLIVLSLAPGYYDTTALTRIFPAILTTPYPFWGVILLSLAGTFLSVWFGDTLMNRLNHNNRHLIHKHNLKLVLTVLFFFFAATAISYYALIERLGIERFIE